MEVRVLRYFLAVAREGSITAAANYLHVTQPTLSRQLKELEEELGTKLFVRRSHSVSLTADGMRLRKRAGEVVDMIEKTEAEFAAKEESVSGDIYIGAGETRVMRHVADILCGIHREYPDIRVHLHSGNLEDVTERLDKGLLDFGILIQPADLGKYDYVNLPEKDVWGVVTRRDSELAAKEVIRREDLLGVPLVVSRQAVNRTAGRNDFIEWFAEDFDTLSRVATYNLAYNACLLVESGLGHALTIAGLADVSDSSSLCFRLLEPRLETGLNIVWKKYQVFSPAAEIFLEKIQAAFGGSD
ncbi:MAG: LysR family transcriptional regulator [Desulfovibrionaceae bacterium]|nr:LysR family transcriptional regulator [Desulfovibrionaceae bacterium]